MEGENKRRMLDLYGGKRRGLRRRNGMEREGAHT